MKTPIFGNDTQQFHFVGVARPPAAPAARKKPRG
jgi:hypothetical protein